MALAFIAICVLKQTKCKMVYLSSVCTYVCRYVCACVLVCKVKKVKPLAMSALTVRKWSFMYRRQSLCNMTSSSPNSYTTTTHVTCMLYIYKYILEQLLELATGNVFYLAYTDKINHQWWYFINKSNLSIQNKTSRDSPLHYVNYSRKVN